MPIVWQRVCFFTYKKRDFVSIVSEVIVQIINIPSSSIPWLSDDIKKSINDGHWMFFQTSEDDEGNYYLDVGLAIFELSPGGEILRNTPKSEFMQEISSILYFEDFQKPQSLSNAIFAYA